jgi:hypothetical protein
VQVGPADATGSDLDEDFIGRRHWRWRIDGPKRTTRHRQDHGTHYRVPLTFIKAALASVYRPGRRPMFDDMFASTRSERLPKVHRLFVATEEGILPGVITTTDVLRHSKA